MSVSVSFQHPQQHHMIFDLRRRRRDLGVLYLHAGLFDEAAAELSEYYRRTTRPSAAAAAAAAGLTSEDPFDLKLTQLLLKLIETGGAPGGEAASGVAAATASGAAAAKGGEGENAGQRRGTLLAAGSAAAAAARGDASVQGGFGPHAARLMSVEKILEAAGDARGSGAGGAFDRSKLPLTW
jgi:hypothetical protein